MVCTFLRGGFSLFALHLVGAGPRPYRMHPMASPMRGSCRREATDEVGQLRKRKTPTSSVSASPSHLPWKGSAIKRRRASGILGLSDTNKKWQDSRSSDGKTFTEGQKSFSHEYLLSQPDAATNFMPRSTT